MRTTIFVMALALALGGCANWPLYSHLPDPDIPVPVPTETSYEEDLAVPNDQIQQVGTLAAPAILTITGSVDACGYDPEAVEFAWPEHPVDDDGDGQPDGFASLTGWYTGDIDLYGFDASTDGWLDASLEWANAPEGDLNAPWRPSEPDGDWAVESDLDFVVFDDGLISSDGGVSRAYPEESPQVLFVGSGTDRVVGVSCHHELPTDYTLTLYLRSL
ncbi:MAG: hypothetical protein GY898_16855 [Proteobacteria bacterium]|nr:hypothetical protein [Pseudomonadota bacterium]